MMNKTLYRLAYQNIIKYKKHYIFVFLILLFISVFYSSYPIVQNSFFDVKRIANEQEYGSWYFYGDIQEKEKFDEIAYQYEEENGFHYAYLYRQGVNEDGYDVAYADSDFYELCQVKLVEGHFPAATNEITVSQELSSEEKYQIGNTVKMKTSSLEMQEYKIVGVVHNSQDHYFSDIYTNRQSEYGRVTLFCDKSLIIDNDTELYSQVPIYVVYNDEGCLDVNNYGYDHTMYLEKYQGAQFDLIVVLQVLIITSLVLLAFASASLKQRSHEFALLRGLGMTTKQLILMNFYEYALCVFMSIFLGTLLSLLVSYGIMLIIEHMNGVFYITFSLSQLCLNAISLFICVIITFLYPISQSSRHALSGTFESYRFQYIQVRYRKLHYQNKWRLAWRELKVNKKIHIFLIMILCFHTSFILMNKTTDYYNEQNEDNQYIYFEKTKKLRLLGDYDFHSLDLNNIYYTHSQNEVSIIYKGTKAYIDDVYTCDDQLLKKSEIVGRLPSRDDEVLIHNQPELYLQESDSFRELLDVQLSIGDSFQVSGKNVTIVGIIQPAEILEYSQSSNHSFEIKRYFLSTYSGLYVTPSLYKSINGKYKQDYIDIYYQTEKEKNIAKDKILSQYPELLNGIKDNKRAQVYSQTAPFVEILINSYVLYASIGVCIFLCYFINKNEMLNRKNDYALMQLIGMTKRDLLNKQIAKGVIIFIFIICIQMLLIIMNCLYLNTWKIPYLQFILISFFTFIICLFIYVTPLFFVFKHKPLDNLNKID